MSSKHILQCHTSDYAPREKELLFAHGPCKRRGRRYPAWVTKDDFYSYAILQLPPSEATYQGSQDIALCLTLVQQQQQYSGESKFMSKNVAGHNSEMSTRLCDCRR